MQLLLVAVAAFCAGLALGVLVDATRRRAADAALRSELDTERRQIMSAAVAAMRQVRAESSQAALDTAISVASSKLGDQLSVGKHVIDRERASVSDQVQVLTDELHRVANLVQSLQVERAEQQGTLTKGIESAMAVTRALADTTESLRQALASPKARGQWGERMAADVLAAAGFVEGVNFARERRLEGGTVPDYTFFLPKGHLVHMDVKFPIDN
ncbi:MAG: DNA recombination protein RmuC, partial [Acidimicrobiales bacterium]